MNHDFIEIGSQLKREREGRALQLSDVSRVTKIPERSLVRLEEGKFEELPGEVFIRGFLRSYARCVGLDGEELVRRYGEITHTNTRVEVPSLDEDRRDVSDTAVPDQAPPQGAQPTPAEQGDESSPTRDSPTQELNLIARAIADVGRGTQRVSLPLAVIILVVVATLTMSLLLRRPDRRGDGLSLEGSGPPPASASSLSLAHRA
jgi:cytoskeletal protein RodZ